MTDNNNKLTNYFRNQMMYDKFINEIDAKEIPSMYIEKVMVFYEDGTLVTIPRKELPQSVYVANYHRWLDKSYKTKPIDDVKIYIDTALMGNDVKRMVQPFLQKFFT